MPCLSSRAVSALNASIRGWNAASQLAVPLITTTFLGSSVNSSPKGSAVWTLAEGGGGAAGGAVSALGGSAGALGCAGGGGARGGGGFFRGGGVRRGLGLGRRRDRRRRWCGAGHSRRARGRRG